MFIKAWDIKTGDVIKERLSENCVGLYTVIKTFRLSQEEQGHSSAVVIVLRGSYSPDWRVLESGHFVEIEDRQD